MHKNQPGVEPRFAAQPGSGEELFQWVRSWAAAPQRADQDFPKIAGATLRQEVRISCGGSGVRIRFTNEFGRTGVTIGAARVGIAGSDRFAGAANRPVAVANQGSADLIAAYRQIIDRAHAHGMAVFGATLTPIGGSDHSAPDGEAARQHVNEDPE